MEELIGHLSCIHGLDNAARNRAETYLQQAALQPGFAYALVQVATRHDLNENMRQLAAVLVHHHVKQHWSTLSEKFQEPQTSGEEKAAIRALLPQVLADPSVKIRNAAAMAISVIASWDWTGPWPDVVQSLLGCLQSDNFDLVSGAMKCLDLFAGQKNLTDQEIPAFVNLAFPEIMKMFSEREKYPDVLRMRCVRILYSVIHWFETMKDVHTKAINDILSKVLPHWVEMFQHDLSLPDTFERPHGVKIAILQVLILLVKEFPTHVGEHIGQLLQPIWNSLVNALNIWQKVAIEDSVEDPSKADLDSGDRLDFESYVGMLVEVLTAIAERKRFQQFFESGLPDLMQAIMGLIQLTEQQIEDYSMDINDFSADEDDDSFRFSTRIACTTMLHVMGEHFDVRALAALQIATERALAQADNQKSQNFSLWWKLREGVLQSVGSVFGGFSRAIQDRLMFDENFHSKKIPFDKLGFAQRILLHDIEPSNPPYLRGRALWCASKLLGDEDGIDDDEDYFGLAPKRKRETAAGSELELVGNFLGNASNTIQQQDDHLPLKLLAVKSFAMLAPMVPKQSLVGSIGNLLPIVTNLCLHLTDDALHSLLDTISVLLPLDPASIEANSTVLISNLISVWMSQIEDPSVGALVCDCFKEIAAKAPDALNELQGRVVPVLMQIFSSTDMNTQPGIVDNAADITQTLVINSPWPMNETLMNQVFPLICEHVLITQDHSLMQSGSLVMLAYIRCAKGHLASWSNGTVSGVDLVLKVLSKALTFESDDGSVYVGPLLSKFLDIFGDQLGDNVADILSAAVRRLVSAENASLRQSLLVVFMRLLRSNPQPTVNFLTNFQLQDGLSAMQYILNMWTMMHEDFHGSYHIKNSIVSLASLFQEPSLDEVQVPGDIAISGKSGIATRSKKTSTEIRNYESLKVRIFKIFVREHMVIIEDLKPPQQFDSDEDDYDDEGYSSDEGGSPFADADTYGLDDAILDDAYDEDDEAADPDVLNDPVYKTNLREFLEGFFKEFLASNQTTFNQFASTLSSDESNHLRTHVFGQK